MASTSPAPDPPAPTAGLHLYRWTDLAVVGVALAAFASGFGQFGAVAALGDVARSFGHVVHGATVADQAGLSGTDLGVGLAVIRLASLAGLPLAGLADRFGRRRTLLVTATIGLSLTVATALSPTYWAFVAIFAFGRPFLSATNALAGVCAGEQTAASDRAKAVALVAAGYGVGAGMTAIVHSLASASLGFRGVFALAVVPMAALVPVARWTTEPDRFEVEAEAAEHPMPVLGAVGHPFRRRLLVLVALAFAVSVITGPANTFVFLYAQNVVHLSGVATASMVAAAGLSGLVGLLAGRWLADRVGRRLTIAVGMAGLAVFGTIAYSGSREALVAGYVLGVLAGSVLAPAVGALLNETFPTSVRASAAGWWVAAGVIGAAVGLVAFGAIADVGNRFGVAAAAIFLPASVAVGLLWLLPETRGREPEELWAGS